MSVVRSESVRSDAGGFARALDRAIEKRRALIESRVTEAMRVFSAGADGVPGVYVDVYGAGAVVLLYEGQTAHGLNEAEVCESVRVRLGSMGVRGVYVKRFPRDRSKVGGELPPEVLSPVPACGEALPEVVVVREHAWKFEVRLYDGFSTGIFLDQRENRRFVYERAKAKRGMRLLNTFAYTCGFSAAAAVAGAETTSVDVSARYLEWGKRNFALNGIDLDAAKHWFAKMDTFDFLGYAAKKGLRYDMIVLDPPSFASGNRRKGIRPWSSVADYARLVGAAAEVLERGGVMIASTNTQELCRDDRLRREVVKGMGVRGGSLRWIELPRVPKDFADEVGRFAAVAWG